MSQNLLTGRAAPISALFARPNLRHPPGSRGGSIRDPLGRNRMDFLPEEIPLPDLGGLLEAARAAWREGAGLEDLFGAETLHLFGSVGPRGQNRPGDVFKTQTLLHRLGYRDAARTDGPTGFLGSSDPAAIAAFQRDHGLTPDGGLLPGGETITALSGYADPGHPAAGGAARSVVHVQAYQRASGGVRAHDRGAPGGGGKAGGRKPPRRIDPGPEGRITFENDTKGGASPDQAVDDRLANALETAAQDTGFDLNVNSTQRNSTNDRSPHNDQRAADINRVNGRRVSDPAARDDVDRLAKSLAGQPGVSQVISPGYSVNIAPDGTRTPITDKGLLNDHKDHIHVGVRAF